MKQSDFWDKLKQTLRDVSTAAADFTEEQALIGKLKFEVLNIKRKIDRLFRDLGIYIRELAEMDPLPQPFDDDEVKQLLENIRELEEQVQQKRDEIDNVAAHFREKAASRQQEKETTSDFDDIPPEDPTSETPPEPEAKPDPKKDDGPPPKPRQTRKPRKPKQD